MGCLSAAWAHAADPCFAGWGHPAFSGELPKAAFSVSASESFPHPTGLSDSIPIPIAMPIPRGGEGGFHHLGDPGSKFESLS